MDIVINLPDEIAGRLTVYGPDLPRHVLECVAIQEFRNGNITKPELRRMLGFATRYQLDGFMKTHDLFEPYTIEDFDLEQKALRDAGF